MEHEFKPGSIVYLKSGSPAMTVVEVHGGNDPLICKWFTADGKCENDAFYEAALTRAMTDSWEETARLHCNNEQYYRGLLDEIAYSLGSRAFVSDDGSVQDSPVRAKLPEMVKELVRSEG